MKESPVRFPNFSSTTLVICILLPGMLVIFVFINLLRKKIKKQQQKNSLSLVNRNKYSYLAWLF
jgi:hypothetical protein